MAKVQNTFLKSKMNKDLDARILPEGEYRDARNAQISKSESAQVGNLENTLGNISVSDYFGLTGATDIVCIGAFPDELNSVVYLFFTDYKDENPNRFVYNPNAKNFIISTNILSNESTILVKGAFLNFSQTNLITGVNVLEDLLFFTDNRNQPRVINTTLANPNPSDTNPIYYSTEDQISVAKYNPYEAIELYNKSLLSTDPVPYETTMKDVSSLFLPNGGSALCTANSIIADFDVDNVQGEINIAGGSAYGAGGASKIFLQDNLSAGTNELTDTGETVSAVVDNGGGNFTITATGAISVLNNQRVVFNANPYYDPTFAGDPDYLESKFARFSYRYKFVDNEYSIFAPFTQITFIPKQDGYFMFVDPNNVSNTGSQAKNDQDEAYRSTIVYFVENKVNQIDLRIPLPFTNYTLEDGLKIKSLDILYKESDGLAVRVVETIPIDVINNQSAICLTNEPAFAGGSTINIKDIQGGIQVGSVVTGVGIPDGTTVVSFTPTDPSNPVSGVLEISATLLAGELDDNILLEIGDTNYFTYSYESTKPTKTLPESNLIRVFDKIPVRAKAQEVAGNRVIYGNFQNKITPPEFLNYNVTSNNKSNFNINEAISSYVGLAATYAAGTPIAINVGKADGGFFPGMFVSSNVYGVNIPANTELTSTNNNGTGPATITLSNDVTFPSGAITPVVLIFEPGANVQDSTSKIEYPNSSVKTNRNYQIGFVLSDRYGRQSSVILSSEKQNATASFQNFGGSTLYSPYIDQTINPTSWPGNALKVLVNSPIPNNNLYNGDITDPEYNPLGWYSYKIVVKQQEQEYYNVYLPGIMASYPDDITKEIGQTSHTVLINDNINKVPRDLTEVGPDQKQFRSSVQLIGRVQNTTTAITTNVGASNTQYYPNRATDTVSVISTLGDLFDFNPADPPLLNLFPQFYSLESNPLVARLSTEFQIGQLANTNYTPVGATSVDLGGAPSATITLTATSGTTTPPVALNSLVNYLVVGTGIPAETYVDTNTALGVPVGGQFQANLKDASAAGVFVDLPDGVQISFIPTDGPGAIPAFELTRPGIQYLAVAETEPVESALDIFWETSTSGLISDLNAAILNSQSQPAANNITWNPSFDESLAENGQILASAFSLVDSFGQTIPITATDIVEFGAPNNGPAVTNGNGDDVNGAGFVSTTNVRDYFRLVDLGSSPTGFGPYQIQTTSQTTPAGLGGPVSASSNYYDNIYYFYNEEEALRQFNFTFRIVVDGQENFITKSANLANVAPEFFVIEAINNPGANQTYGPGGALPMPALVPVDSNKGVLEIAKLQINNGANNTVDPNPNGGRALSTRDLKIVDQQFNDQGIWSQNFGSANGPVAEIDGQPIFSILTDTNTNTGVLNYKIVNNFFFSTELVAAGIYYITLALQDGGGTLVFQQIEVDLRLSLGNDNFWNKSHEVDQYGIFAETYNGSPPQFLLTPDGFEDYCGNNCQSASNRTNWWHFPSTLFEIRNTDPGSSQNDYGWYIYGLGFFDNTSDDAALCCDSTNNHGVSGSFSMVEYSQLAGTGSTITIPMSTPLTAGEHLVQTQTKDVVNMPITATQIPQWGLPPLIHGRIAVTDYDPVNYLWTYEILEGDDATPVEGGAPGTALTGCMKIFVDVGGDVANPGAGWNYNDGPITQGQMQTRVINGRPGKRVERIKYTTVNGAGDKQFYYKVQPDAGNIDGRNRGGIAILDPNWNFLVDGPQIVYSYHGPFNYKTSPWFYRPTNGTTTSMQPILEVWAMYKYSGLMPSKWRDTNRFNWERWNQHWDVGLYPPTPFDNEALQKGIYELMENGEPGCISHPAQVGQIWKPDNADQFQFSVI